MVMRLTAHAEDMITERSIAMEWILAALSHPDSQSPDPRDPTLTRSYCKISSAGERILRVVHRADGPDTLVITAFFDRGIKL
jgi:hypothetical protein